MAMGIPATVHAIWALKPLGTKRLQLWGFVWIASAFALLAAVWRPLDHGNANHIIRFVVRQMDHIMCFVVRRPPQASASAPCPVVCCHCGGGSAACRLSWSKPGHGCQPLIQA
jgi:hypothetical protein